MMEALEKLDLRSMDLKEEKKRESFACSLKSVPIDGKIEFDRLNAGVR